MSDSAPELAEIIAELTAERDDILVEIARLPSGDPDAAVLCGRAGEVSHRLYTLKEQGEDEEDAALALEAFTHAFAGPAAVAAMAAAGPEGDGAVWAAWRILFADLRARQYDREPSRELAEEIWRLLTGGAPVLPADDPDFAGVRSLARTLLAGCAEVRYQCRTPDDDAAALLDEALRRNRDALTAVVEPDGAAPDGAEPDDTELYDAEASRLRTTLGFLHLERALATGSADDADEAVRHYRTALESAPPGADDLPELRQCLAFAQLVHGRAVSDRDELEAARDAYGTALTEARLRGGPAPDWAAEAELNSVFIRMLIWAVWKDRAHGAAAEVELTRLLADPDAVAGLLPHYLDGFGRLLYERAAERDDDEGRDRAVALIRRAVAEWEPGRDGDVAATAMFLAAFQQIRYQDDGDPRRARDVLDAAGLVLAQEQDPLGIGPTARMMDLWARYVLAGHGLHPQTDGAPEGVDGGEALEIFGTLFTELAEGRNLVDIARDEHLPGLGRDMAGEERRRAYFEQTLAKIREAEPGEARARTAAVMLSSLSVFDPDYAFVTAEHRRELTDAMMEHAAVDPAWRGQAHAVAGTSLLGHEQIRTSGGLDTALAHFDQAEAAGGVGGEYSFGLARLLAQTQRGQTGGGTDDLEAGLAGWRRLRDNPALPAGLRRTMELQKDGFDAMAAVQRGDLPAADAAVARLAAGWAELTDEGTTRIEVFTLLENARSSRDSLARRLGVSPLPPLPGRPTVTELRRQAARLPRDHRAWVLGDNGISRFSQAGRVQDGPGLLEAARLLQEAHDLSDPGGHNRLRYANTLGMAHCALASLQIDRVRARDRLARGITHLENAFAEAKGPENRLYAVTALNLARAHRMRDDSARRDRAASRRIGLDSLRGHAWAALLQSGTDHATLAAAQATEAALEVAGWCLRDDRPEEALRALDACRGLVLHAAVTSTGVPGLLAAAGHTELADEWRLSGADAAQTPADPLTAAQAPPVVPSSLRRRVLAALTEGDDPRAGLLLDPPDPGEIGRALRSLGRDALVYLVPASAAEDLAGTAVVVTSRGAVHSVPLPSLKEDAAPLREYAPAGIPLGAGREEPAAARDLGPVPGHQGNGTTPPPALRAQLDRLCGWAWYAGMRPLLEAFEMPGGRLPRLVLVPMGALGLVPWHAAWQAGGPRGRQYALQAAEISYAASARLLCLVAARPAPARTGAALVVGNPTGDLYYAGEEADAVQRAFYPGGRFLGRRGTGPADGEGTPREVLDWLRSAPEPGEESGGVLHLACHASVAANARRSAYLSLSGGRLAAEELTEAIGPDGGRLGLVLLAACRSHVSGRGHNEAYSLATAFLVAGARSVVGSLWPVPDEATSVLMYLTHHYLSIHGEPPARALRRAQLWMLDPHREPPDGLPDALRDRIGRIDPHDLSAWAGFTHLGQ
jgi:CHAT domain